MIEAQHLSKHFADVVAVHDFSCHITAGTIVGLLGSNGAGKTTVMRMLCGYLPPTTGEVWLNGYSMFRTPQQAKSQLGYMPESVALYGDMRVRDYLSYVAGLKKVKSGLIAWRVAQVIEQCALGAVAGQKISRLSRGYRQRTGLAQALVADPPILIVDEPTSALDPAQIEETRKLLRELAAGKAILMSTHILGEVEQICQAAIMLRQGKIVLAGKLADLLQVNCVVVQSDAPADELRQRICQLAGVVSVENITPQVLRVQFSVGHDPRPAIGQICRGCNWALSRLELVTGTLEQVYLKATSR
jgi:ABC-2 type transport system ATP-binding protein